MTVFHNVCMVYTAMWSRSKPFCDMLLTERKQLKSTPGCGGLTSTTWNEVKGVRGLKQKCLPLGGGMEV